MNPPRFEDGHAVLDPQEWLVGIDLREQEPGPAPVARVRCEDFGKCAHPPLHLQGRGTARRAVEGPSYGLQDPSTMLRMVPLPEKSRGG